MIIEISKTEATRLLKKGLGLDPSEDLEFRLTEMIPVDIIVASQTKDEAIKSGQKLSLIKGLRYLIPGLGLANAKTESENGVDTFIHSVRSEEAARKYIKALNEMTYGAALPSISKKCHTTLLDI